VGGGHGPRPKRSTRRGQRTERDSRFLVAELEGDEDKKQTGHVIAELEKQFPPRGEASLHIIPYPDVLSVGRGERSAALEAAEKKGRDWLTKKHGDVLIWGEVADKNKVLRLRFVTPRDGGAAKPYSLNEKLELPVDFGSDLGAVLSAQAASAISPIYDRSGEALAALIAPIVAKLKPLAESPPASFPEETRAQLWNAYAAGEKRLGEERGDNARLASAIAYYKKALTIWTRDKVPLKWAMTQNNLGEALRVLGERESGTARLEEAVAAYRAALLEYTRDKVPLDWAMTQNNLGSALQRLGERESGTARLEEAVAAYRDALQERTREKVPLQWAMTQNNLGNALWSLGEREAQTHEAKGCATLKTARDHSAAALEEFQKAGASYYVEVAQGNVARLDRVIARLCGG
jgi:tetratricopeptide (TPR) repeat protein